jgi:hypothetical protein
MPTARSIAWRLSRCHIFSSRSCRPRRRNRNSRLRQWRDVVGQCVLQIHSSCPRAASGSARVVRLQNGTQQQIRFMRSWLEWIGSGLLNRYTQVRILSSAPTWSRSSVEELPGPNGMVGGSNPSGIANTESWGSGLTQRPAKTPYRKVPSVQIGHSPPPNKCGLGILAVPCASNAVMRVRFPQSAPNMRRSSSGRTLAFQAGEHQFESDTSHQFIAGPSARKLAFEADQVGSTPTPAASLPV